MNLAGAPVVVFEEVPYELFFTVGKFTKRQNGEKRPDGCAP